MSRAHSHSRAHSPSFPSLHLHHTSFSKLSVISPTPQLILQPFRRFTYATAHSPTPSFASPTSQLCSSPTFSSLDLRHSSFSNPSVASPTSQLIPQTLLLLPLRHSSAHSPTFSSLHIRQSSFSNPSVASPMSAHFPTLLLLHLCHSSFSNPSVASPTSQLILQPLRRFTYVTAHSPNPSFASPTSQALHLCHLASRP